jgi:NAD(P)-dependent dehydrogenase (short-subunit alcohol dehydrogenase family)
VRLEPWPKLTGGKGFHLMAPLDRTIGHDAARAYAKQIAQRRKRREQCVDVIDRAAMAAWVGEVDRDAPLDLVIANAGTAGRHLPHGPERTRAIFAVNLYGMLNTIEPAETAMAARGPRPPCLDEFDRQLLRLAELARLLQQQGGGARARRSSARAWREAASWCR